MTEVKRRLFDAFRDDHALLGRALHELGERLRAADAVGARDRAHRLDIEAGAHVAFEERDFYPALAPFLEPAEIDAMYTEHVEARALLADIAALADDALAADVPGNVARRDDLLARVHEMESHVSECGELFGVMGGLDDDAQRRLLDRLEEQRERAPRWSELEAPPGRGSR